MLGATLLMYNLDGPAGAALKVLCRKTRVQWKEVPPEDYARPLGALVGLPAPAAEAPAAPAVSFSEPMLVMAGLLRPQFDALLQGMRQQGIRVPLKAVLTPTNVTWTSLQLHDELIREHEAVTRGRQGDQN